MTQVHHRVPSQYTGAATGRNRRAGIKPVHLETRGLSRSLAVRPTEKRGGVQ
jgi:hypothetical protein